MGTDSTALAVRCIVGKQSQREEARRQRQLCETGRREQPGMPTLNEARRHPRLPPANTREAPMGMGLRTIQSVFTLTWDSVHRAAEHQKTLQGSTGEFGETRELRTLQVPRPLRPQLEARNSGCAECLEAQGKAKPDTALPGLQGRAAG